MIKFRGATSDLSKANSCLTKTPIQSKVPWEGRSAPLDGGGGGPNGEPSSGHHGEPLNEPLSQHLSGPVNKPPSEHSREPFISLASKHFGGISGGPPNGAQSGPPGRPQSGPPMGPYLSPKGYLIMVPLQWAHGQDILGEPRY
jgi:hypothetical protein